MWKQEKLEIVDTRKMSTTASIPILEFYGMKKLCH